MFLSRAPWFLVDVMARWESGPYSVSKVLLALGNEFGSIIRVGNEYYKRGVGCIVESHRKMFNVARPERKKVSRGHTLDLLVLDLSVLGVCAEELFEKRGVNCERKTHKILHCILTPREREGRSRSSSRSRSRPKSGLAWRGLCLLLPWWCLML